MAKLLPEAKGQAWLEGALIVVIDPDGARIARLRQDAFGQAIRTANKAECTFWQRA